MRSFLDEELDDLDRTIDDASEQLGDTSLAGLALDSATAPSHGEPVAPTIREQQLAQFRASRAERGQPPLPEPDARQRGGL